MERQTVYIKDLKGNIIETQLVNEKEERMEELEKENKNLKEKIQTLELWLDNKEKLDEELID